MKNGKVFLRTPTLGRRLKVSIVIGLCCYVMLLGVTALIHDHTAHSHFGTTHSHSEDTCAACFYNSQHVGVEIESFALASPLFFSAALPLYEAAFLPLRPTANTRSRAPPVFSNDPQNLDLKGRICFRFTPL